MPTKRHLAPHRPAFPGVLPLFAFASLTVLACSHDEPAAEAVSAIPAEPASAEMLAQAEDRTEGWADDEASADTAPMEAPADPQRARGARAVAARRPASPAPALRPTASAAGTTGMQGAPLGGFGAGGGEVQDAWADPGRVRRARPAPPARVAPAAAPLPQNAVLSSTFVGGRGAQARLEDLLDRGVMVGGENVRLEAFDELGRLPYAVPSEEAVGLHAELERSRLLNGGETVHMQIALMARQGEAPPRPRMDIRLVLDRSGSMQGEKWTQAIQAAHQLVDRLRPRDTFGLISYSDEASLDFAPARVGDGRSAHAAINRLEAGGGTNIDSALQMAAAHAPRRRGMSDVLLNVLVSDGVATLGRTDPDSLGRMARSSFDASGVLTTSVGLGTDFDEDTMLAIAREGSGSYHFVRRAADISDILTDELEERAQAVAQALRLRVELAEGVVATRVYGSTVLDAQQEAAVRRTEIATDRRLAAELGIAQDRQNDEDRGLRIHVPTFRRGDQHVVLMELRVPPGTRAGQIAHVTLDYKDLLSNRNRTAEVDVDAERTRDRQAAIASTRRPVKRTVLAFQAGDTLSGASDALSHGDPATARRLLAERQRVLVAAADLWHDDALARDADLLGRYDRVLSGAWNGWDSGSQRTLMMAMNFYGNQRMR
ncbi:MAG: VWA domain-containing protein [Sandaracinaceae bacterium]